MRHLLIVLIVLTCMAATVRIDGVWPPAPLRQHLETVVTSLVEPGKALIASARWQLLSGPAEAVARDVIPLDFQLPLPRAIAGGTIGTGDQASNCG